MWGNKRSFEIIKDCDLCGTATTNYQAFGDKANIKE